ncbi:SusC/RagA family TonB-linked outer membrane protein [Sphingobacterium puteale]|uniref:SusC/RagA family TonB-linked outer membrane protein n=2 Tax=Sphingobacterium puteale TaxID=2420510 RepID=A0A420VZL2_9SPHI|nr:SusC/RagA family TonB-linked outer membrane protein [Sphingobacterium puteale]
MYHFFTKKDVGGFFCLVPTDEQSTGEKSVSRIFTNALMKISLSSLLLLGMMGVQASTMAQRVNINKKNVSLRKILQEINIQTGYHYLWAAPNIDPLTCTSVSFNNLPLQEALKILEKNTPIFFELEKDMIMVKPRQPEIGSIQLKETILLLNLKNQSKIRGKVVDENGNVLVGANVMVQGRKKGTVTDGNGEFTLDNSSIGTNIIISYIGYESITIPVTNNLGVITLALKTGTLNEATVEVNTGYQKLPKDRVTGSFSYVSGEKLEKKLATDLKSALEGQTTGLTIDKAGKIEIRGVSTFNAQKTPLIVIDGYPVETTIDDINPMNIASITVLKDGVAASIYGSRAANGVIVVTTKSGQNSEPKISYSGFVNIIQKPQLKYLNKATTSDYIDAEIDLFNLNPNGPSTMDPYNMSRVTYLLMQEREGKISHQDAMAEIDGLRSINALNQIQDLFFRNKVTHQHNINIAGGSPKSSYNFSVNYQQTKDNLINNDSKRLITDFKNEWQLFPFLTAGAAANFTYNKGNSTSFTYSTIYGPELVGDNYQSLAGFSGGSMIMPYTNLLDDNGNPAAIWGISQYKVNTYKNTPGMKSWDYVPLEDMGKMPSYSNSYNFRMSGFLRANIVEGLTAEVGGNWVKGTANVKNIQRADSYNARIAYNDGTSKSNPANHYIPDGSILDEFKNINETWTLRTQLNYSKNFSDNKHLLHALVGNEIRKITSDNNRLATRAGYNENAGSFIPVNIKDFTAGIYNADMLFPNGSVSLTDGLLTYGDNRFVSWYANGSYEYDNRFILSGSMRLDLTNFFGTDKKYRYKPMWSLGGTYKLSNEKWWDKAVFSKLNIRGSYGINGNISLRNGPFLILSVGNYSPTTGGVSYGISSPPNKQLRWEKTKIANVGIDFGLLNNAIEGSFDYYNKNSSDLLAADAADPTLGFSSLTKNVGKMTNHGFELGLNVHAIKNSKFSWDILPNISFNANKVKHYNVNRPYTGSYTTAGGIMVAGYPSDGLWGYRFAGLNELGQTQVYTRDNQVVLASNAEVTDLVYQGTFRPKWDLALTNRFSYQNWDLSFMFIAKLGHKYRKDTFSGSNYQNRHVAERWRKPGDEKNTIYPVLEEWNMDMFSFPFADVNVGNASYAKLRDITLSYNLEKLSKRIGLTNARIFVQGRNLFRITAKGVDVDPETTEFNVSGGTGAGTDQGFTSLPLPREIFIGLRFGL